MKPFKLTFFGTFLGILLTFFTGCGNLGTEMLIDGAYDIAGDVIINTIVNAPWTAPDEQIDSSAEEVEPIDIATEGGQEVAIDCNFPKNIDEWNSCKEIEWYTCKDNWCRPTIGSSAIDT